MKKLRPAIVSITLTIKACGETNGMSKSPKSAPAAALKRFNRRIEHTKQQRTARRTEPQ